MGACAALARRAQSCACAASLTPSARVTTQAVEPQLKVDNVDKGLMGFAPVIGVAALAVLSVPLLPVLFASNPDQA